MISFGKGYAFLCAILPVTQKGMAGVGEVDADLVRASGDEMDLYHRIKRPFRIQGSVKPGFHRSGPRFFVVQIGNPVFPFILIIHPLKVPFSSVFPQTMAI